MLGGASSLKSPRIARSVEPVIPKTQASSSNKASWPEAILPSSTNARALAAGVRAADPVSIHDNRVTGSIHPCFGSSSTAYSRITAARSPCAYRKFRLS